MKKNEIILARIISTASACALALLILIAGIRSDYFSRIALKLNNNTITGEGANLYNYYYYAGLHVLFQFLFMATVLALVISILAILFRLKHCQLMCKVAAVSSFITGIFLLFARVYEDSVGAHRLIAGFYMGNVSGSDIVTGQFLPKIPIWTILFIMVSVLLYMFVRVTKFEKIKLYADKAGCDALHVFIAGLYSTLFLDVIRDYLVYGFSLTMNASELMAYHYVREYFVAERWLLCIPFAVYAALAAGFTIALRSRLSRNIHQMLSMGIPVLLAGVIGIYYMMNPAGIFGRLTLDEHICDITESSMSWYLIQMIVAVMFFTVLIFYTYMKLSLSKVFIIIGINAGLTLTLLWIGKLIFGLSGLYMGCVTADIISMVITVFYSNHHMKSAV